MTADHSRYDRSIDKSARKTNQFADESRSLVSSIALIDGPLGGIASRASNLNQILNRGHLALGLFSLGMASAAFGTIKMLKVVSQVEVEMGKTDAILKATSNSSRMFGGELDTLARKVARSTLASTTDIRQSINTLLTFRSVGRNVFQDVIVLSQDMAATWGGSASTNARKLGKALDDPITQLSRLETATGRFNEKVREQILLSAKAGDTMRAQSLIVEQLQGKLGGSGSAETGGLAGSVDTLGQAWDELFEGLDKRSGAADKTTWFINRMAKGVDTLTEAVREYNANELFSKKLNLELRLSEARLKENRRLIGGLGLQLKRVNKELAIKSMADQKQHIENVRLYDLAVKARKLELAANKLEKEKQERLKNEIALTKTLLTSEVEAAEAKAKRNKEEEARLLKLTKDMTAIRLTGLSPLVKENELYEKNIELFRQYKTEFGDSSLIKTAISNENVRHLGAQNDAVFDQRSSQLNNQLGSVPKEDVNIDSFDREEELFKARNAMIKSFRDEDIKNQKASDKILETEGKRHGEAMIRFTKFEANNKKKAQEDFFSNASSLMNSESRKLFEIGKVAAISSAVVSATESVPHAFNWGMKTGGPLLAGAFATAAIAATAVQIQAISKTQYGSTSTDSSSSGGSIATAEPAFIPFEDTRQEININFQGDITGVDADHIANILKDHIDKTDFVLVSSESRNGQELAA